MNVKSTSLIVTFISIRRSSSMLLVSWKYMFTSTSVKIIKNEVRCRDDTVPKTVDTRKHCKVGLRACNNLPQPQKTRI